MAKIFGLALLVFAFVFAIFLIEGKTERLTNQLWQKADPYIANLFRQVHTYNSSTAFRSR